MNNFFIINDKNIQLNIITHTLENPSAILIHLHGLHGHFQHIYDCVDDFEYRIKYLQKANILSYALEFRGHGKSSGPKGYVEDIDNLLNDIKRLLEYIYCLHPNKPIFLLAESMGAALAVKTSMLIDKIDGIILLAPMFNISKKTRPTQFTMNFLLGLSKIFPRLKLINKNKRRPYNYEKYNEKFYLSEYTNKDNINLGTFRQCYNICVWIDENKKLFDKKILIIHSIEDTVTCIDQSKDFYNECSSTDKDIFILEKGEHCIMVPLDENDILPHVVVSKITNWINSRI